MSSINKNNQSDAARSEPLKNEASESESNQVQPHALIAGRWSPRAFEADKPVETEKLAACLEAARWSSSCYGEQPWRFIVADRSTHPDVWQAMLECLAEANQSWAMHAPVLILACAKTAFSHNSKPNRWAQYDTGQAMMSFSLQAVAEGLITHPMGGFDVQLAANTFHIPDDITAMSVTALGYLGAAESIATADRQRKDMQDIAFTSWGEAWQN